MFSLVLIFCLALLTLTGARGAYMNVKHFIFYVLKQLSIIH